MQFSLVIIFVSTILHISALALIYAGSIVDEILRHDKVFLIEFK